VAAIRCSLQYKKFSYQSFINCATASEGTEKETIRKSTDKNKEMG
jgi:hypothetical protein